MEENDSLSVKKKKIIKFLNKKKITLYKIKRIRRNNSNLTFWET